MSTIDFNELKAKKDGVLTPKSMITNVLENIDEVDKVVVVIRTKDKQVIHGVSDMNHLIAIGLYEAGKALVFNNMWEEN